MPHRPRILTWQVHGNYCFYLTQVPVDWYLVTKPGHPPGYAGRTPSFPWGDNVHEIAPQDIARTPFDCVLYQSRLQWESDRLELLSPAQRAMLPSIYLEHDPPQRHPTDTAHWAQQATLLVHVTPFNALMWDSVAVPVRVIEHGVLLPEGVEWIGDRPQGIVCINHLERRGRRLGADLYEQFRREVPLVLAGMGSASLFGGLGEIPNRELPALMAHYRFFFNPVRWTSLGLAVVEAMSLGMPIVALATTEMSSVIDRGVNGWVDTDPARLVDVMRLLIHDREVARRWGEAARESARQRFGLQRFIDDWRGAIDAVLGREAPQLRRA